MYANVSEMNSTQLSSPSYQEFNYTVQRSVFLTIVYGFEAIVVIVSNILILTAVGTSQNLRKPQDLLIINLACTDLVLGVTVLPSMTFLEIIQTSTIFKTEFCLLVKMFDLACISASVSTICAMSVDRHIAISRPLQYRHLMTTRTVLFIISIIWIQSFALVGPMPFSWNNENGCFMLNYPFHVLLTGLLLFYVKISIVIVLNINIYLIIRKRHYALASAVNISNNQNWCLNLKTLQLKHKDTKFTSRSSPQTANVINSSTKMENLINFRQRKDDKAAKTLMTIVGVFVVCLSPVMVTLSIVVFCSSCDVSHNLLLGCLCLLYANSMINPFVYAFSNKDFQAAIKQLFQCKFRR